MDFFELQNRTSMLMLPYASATTIYTALYINYDIKPTPSSAISAAKAWDEMYHNLATEKAKEVAKRWMIDAKLAASLARNVYVRRCQLLNNPSQYVGMLMGYMSDSEIYRRALNENSLPEDKLLQVFYFVANWMAVQSNLSLGFGSNAHADKIASAAYEDYLNEHGEDISGYSKLVLSVIREVVTDIFAIFNVISDVSLIEKPSAYAALALYDLLDAIYTDAEVNRLLIEKFYNKNFFSDDEVEKLHSPLDMSLESEYGQIELNDIEIMMASIDHISNSLNERFEKLSGGKKKVNRAIMSKLKSEYPDTLCHVNEHAFSSELTEENYDLAMEGVIDGTAKLVRKVIIRIFKTIRDAINAVLKVIGKPFNIRLRFVVEDDAEPEEYVQEWGKAFNTALDDYLESNPILDSRIQPQVNFIRAAVEMAQEVSMASKNLAKDITQAIKDQSVNTFNRAIEDSQHQYKEIAFNMNMLPIESRIFPELVDYIEPEPKDKMPLLRGIDQPISKYMRAVRDKVRELEDSKVNHRMSALGDIKNAVHMANEQNLERIIERTEDDLKEVDSIAKAMRKEIDLIKEESLSGLDVRGRGEAEGYVKTFNNIQRELAELMFALANSVTTSNQVFFKLARRTAEMNKQANAIFK